MDYTSQRFSAGPQYYHHPYSSRAEVDEPDYLPHGNSSHPYMNTYGHGGSELPYSAGSGTHRNSHLMHGSNSSYSRQTGTHPGLNSHNYSRHPPPSSMHGMRASTPAPRYSFADTSGLSFASSSLLDNGYPPNPVLDRRPSTAEPILHHPSDYRGRSPVRGTRPREAPGEYRNGGSFRGSGLGVTVPGLDVVGADADFYAERTYRRPESASYHRPPINGASRTDLRDRSVFELPHSRSGSPFGYESLSSRGHGRKFSTSSSVDFSPAFERDLMSERSVTSNRDYSETRMEYNKRNSTAIISLGNVDSFGRTSTTSNSRMSQSGHYTSGHETRKYQHHRTPSAFSVSSTASEKRVASPPPMASLSDSRAKSNAPVHPSLPKSLQEHSKFIEVLIQKSQPNTVEVSPGEKDSESKADSSPATPKPAPAQPQPTSHSSTPTLKVNTTVTNHHTNSINSATDALSLQIDALKIQVEDMRKRFASTNTADNTTMTTPRYKTQATPPPVKVPQSTGLPTPTASPRMTPSSHNFEHASGNGVYHQLASQPSSATLPPPTSPTLSVPASTSSSVLEYKNTTGGHYQYHQQQAQQNQHYGPESLARVDQQALDHGMTCIMRNIKHLQGLTIDMAQMLQNASSSVIGGGLTASGAAMLRNMADVQLSSLNTLIRMADQQMRDQRTIFAAITGRPTGSGTASVGGEMGTNGVSSVASSRRPSVAASVTQNDTGSIAGYSDVSSSLLSFTIPSPSNSSMIVPASTMGRANNGIIDVDLDGSNVNVDGINGTVDIQTMPNGVHGGSLLDSQISQQLQDTPRYQLQHQNSSESHQEQRDLQQTRLSIAASYAATQYENGLYSGSYVSAQRAESNTTPRPTSASANANGNVPRSVVGTPLVSYPVTPRSAATSTISTTFVVTSASPQPPQKQQQQQQQVVETASSFHSGPPSASTITYEKLTPSENGIVESNLRSVGGSIVMEGIGHGSSGVAVNGEGSVLLSPSGHMLTPRETVGVLSPVGVDVKRG
ncbi:hypothetical protein HK102_002423 [Quaeritorhiza haematococci]|nr:hypothetical protein HK102_002423 [Quaeritorhiza haematococci]